MKNDARAIKRVKRLCRSLMATTCLAAVGTVYVGSVAYADDLSDLRAEMRAMAKRMEKLEADKRELEKRNKERAAAGRSDPNAARVASSGDPTINPRWPLPSVRDPGYFDIPGTGTSMKIGGSIRVDAIRGINGLGLGGIPGTDFRLISLDGSNNARRGGSIDFSARNTQITLGTITATPIGDLKTFTSMDFNANNNGSTVQTNSYSPRLREAFGQLDSGANQLLVGQTWSTFMDLIAYPETLDPNGPVGGIYVRQPMVRYTRNLGGGSNFILAVENANSDFEGAVQQTILGSNLPSLNQTTPYPDVVAKYTYDGGWGHFAVAGMVRYISLNTGDVGLAGGTNLNPATFVGTVANPLVPGTKTTVAEAAMVALSVKTFGKDSINMQVSGGSGLGRYQVGDLDNRTAASLQFCNITRTIVCGLENTRQVGGVASYQHYWADNLRSNIAGGYFRYLNTEFPDNTANSVKDMTSVHANLIWTPVERVSLGVEYIWGKLNMLQQPTPGVGPSGVGQRIGTNLKVFF
ncbi:DcaP family trimeric outer membrane transporter [Afipia sp. GAS231]|uniref:DcaP family trimeric outer membrane transporter n=1 Tax=Afipia sp. GAS231 TaxID=1882747 RepID=UPI00087A96C7|nr:DcaP family trimeric outer membrane transporter [Afipia sp. GAS231]SDO52658.1 Porin subfamily protein [Afipia sp. GAS231]